MLEDQAQPDLDDAEGHLYVFIVIEGSALHAREDRISAGGYRLVYESRPVAGLRVVKYVEHFRAELDRESLGHARVLEEPRVELVDPRRNFAVARHSAVRVVEQYGRSRTVENELHQIARRASHDAAREDC